MPFMVALAKTPRPPKLSPEGRKVLLAMRCGIRLAAEQSRRAGIPLAVWHNGRAPDKGSGFVASKSSRGTSLSPLLGDRVAPAAFFGHQVSRSVTPAKIAGSQKV